MWKQYRRTVVPIQLMILTICLIAYFHVGVPILNVLFYFLIMQVFAVIGAWWGVRLRNKVNAGKLRRGKLPTLLD